MTGHAFNPREIGVAIADGRQSADHRLFETELHAGYINARDELCGMAYGELAQYAEAVCALSERSAPFSDQVAALPAGVYISLRELQSIVNETNQICSGDWPYGDGLAPIVINHAPRVSGEECAVILEGFQPMVRGPRRRKTASEAIGDHYVIGQNPLNERDQDRLDVQRIARRIWQCEGNGRLSITSVLRYPEFEAYRRIWKGAHTLRDWVSPVDPRPSRWKPGRRHR